MSKLWLVESEYFLATNVREIRKKKGHVKLKHSSDLKVMKLVITLPSLTIYIYSTPPIPIYDLIITILPPPIRFFRRYFFQNYNATNNKNVKIFTPMLCLFYVQAMVKYPNFKNKIIFHQRVMMGSDYIMSSKLKTKDCISIFTVKKCLSIYISNHGCLCILISLQNLTRENTLNTISL